MKRKVKTYRKKLRLLTDQQYRKSIMVGTYVRAWGGASLPLFSYVNNVW